MKESTIIKISKFLDENGFELLNHKNNTLRIRHLSCDTEFDLIIPLKRILNAFVVILLKN